MAMINYSDLIATKLKNLPVDKQQQVLDFVEFLIQKSTSYLVKSLEVMRSHHRMYTL